ncbi:DUF4294 domain-containing protein [Gangjinia marincola]|uniref:DUF4294 domain-containing protein n=1 Tax=Gangjinia marincola TaxID=578463 RepID=A0ABN1MF86_9FLAO
MKKRIFFVLIAIISLGISAQEKIDTTQVKYLMIEGDSTWRESIDLSEVLILQKLKFDSDLDRRRYLILRRKTRKVWPYATMASERLQALNERLDSIDSKRKRKKYTKQVQKYIEEEFSEKLKKFTRTEGQILIKLIHRQTGDTAYELIKNLRSGWRAFWYDTTASMFDISLKREFDPMNDKEDYLIEDILHRSFSSGRLKKQDPSLNIDFIELLEHWGTKEKAKTVSN